MLDLGPWYVAIGASGGDGLDDIKALLHALPSSLEAVVLVVLHRPWDRASALAQVLTAVSSLPVHLATDGVRLHNGHAYVGAPDEHLTLLKDCLGGLVRDPGRAHANRTVDLLFESVAAHGGRHMIGVVLSGSLDDGARGLAAIKHAGGLSMVLTPGVPERHGMPENAIAFDGPIDLIGSPRQIAQAICVVVPNAMIG